jgi:SAM-dependent methyltransferase
MVDHRQIKQATPFDTEYFENYYENYRNKIDHLFPSERRYLGEIALEESSIKVLDVGCARGGMYEVLKSLNRYVDYFGIDISENLIEHAKLKYPGVKFEIGDGIKLPYCDNFFDFVISFGTTVHDQNYERLIEESLRVSSKDILFDIRLIPDLPTLNDVEKAYVFDGAGIKYPYIVVNIDNFITFLKSLSHNGISVYIYGYWGEANEYANLPEGYKRICMSSVLIRKTGTNGSEFKIHPDMPFDMTW